MGKVILIGGSPQVGKSTVAIELASRLKYAYISTDDIGEALQAVVPLDPMRGMEYREYYTKTAPGQLMADIQQYHKAMEPAIRRLVEIHSTWGGSIVMEGWALYPSVIQALTNDNAAAIWLIAEDALLETRLENRPDFFNGILAARNHYLLRSKQHNALLRKQCAEHNAVSISMDGCEPPEVIAEKIILLASV